MVFKKLQLSLIFLLLLGFNVFSQEFSLTDKGNPLTIYYQIAQQPLDSILANLLAKDIKSVTGKTVIVETDLKKAKGNVIALLQVNGNNKSLKMKDFVKPDFKSKSEVFSWQFLKGASSSKIKQILVISGSDARGLAYGVFKLSEQIGVNPWYYWADVPILQKENLTIPAKDYISKEPSVKYRGIFINDEDWGLNPWASSQIDKELNNVGPKTYAQIFELLLRLKANLIWPAMHPGTKAFFNIPGNLEMAQNYNIIISTSHAEPMLRNNVDEWDEKTMGRFNYLTNKDKIQDYWKTRVLESKNNEVIYTMGMRGVHDSGMEGVKTIKEAVPLTAQIIKDQRQMLTDVLGKNNIPQAITLYKEVLDIYDLGLKVPDDITLVWPDDNYGYIRRLNNEEEAQRPGGSGVYYHASYWGRPHDYLWLSTTPAGLMWEEMLKAYRNNSKKMWILNVGDIKPAEYQTQLFMDMAYDVDPFQENKYVEQHRKQWYENIFSEKGNQIANVMSKYEQLALERKPEYMGWSQTEPTTKIGLTAYNHFYFGDEAQHRIDSYQRLENKINKIGFTIPANLKDAFFELVKYPVFGASSMSKKFLYRDKAILYAKQGRLSALPYQDSVHKAYQNILNLTQFYNDTLANGKWKNMMSMKPRNLPVFEEPALNLALKKANHNWALIAEGQSELSEKDTLSLPCFYVGQNLKYFVDVFLTKEYPLAWKISSNKTGLKYSVNRGDLNVANKTQERIWISLDSTISIKIKEEIIIKIQTNDGDKYIKVNILPVWAETQNKNIFKEMNGYVSIYAENYSANNSSKHKYWNLVNGLGYTNKVMQSILNSNTQDSAILSYNFISTTAAKPIVNVYTIPTHPINKNYSLKYALRIDGSEWIIEDFATKDRNKVWKENVLANIASQKVTFATLNPGKHTLQILMLDPGVMLDRFVIDLKENPKPYAKIEETK